MFGIFQNNSGNVDNSYRQVLAYEACIRESAQQEATLDDMRSRAIGLLSALIVATSIFAAVSGATVTERVASGLAVLFFVMGLFNFYVILFPKFKWSFTQDAKDLLKGNSRVFRHETRESYYRRVIDDLYEGNLENAKYIEKLQKRFKWGLRLFTAELIIWSLTVSFH